MSDGLPEDKITSGYKTVVYTVDDKGNYTRVARTGWEPGDIALEQTWEDINEHIEKIKKRVHAGELSPLSYYMGKHQYSLSRLAGMTGFTKRKIRRDLRPKDFAKLNPEIISVYANAFQITPEQFLKPI